MEEGVKVRNMVETMARRDRQEKAARLSRSMSTGGPSLFSSMNATHSKDECWQIKRQHYKDQGNTRHVDTLLHKISTMRNTMNYTLPYKFEVVESPLVQLGLTVPPRQAPLRIAQNVGVTNLAASKRMDRQVAMALAEKLAGDPDEPDDPGTPD